MKAWITSALGAFGSYCAYMLGGWDWALQSLLIFMAIDYISGIAVAGIFHKSKKSESGNLDSRAGWKGICKKLFTLCFVLIANLLDKQIGTSGVIRDAVCITFMSNELLSIVENAGLMGIPIPASVSNAISALSGKAEAKEAEAKEELKSGTDGK